MRTVRVQVLIVCQDRTAASSSHGNNVNIYGQCICQTQFQAFYIDEVIHPPETKDRCHSLCVIDREPRHRKVKQFTDGSTEDLRFEYTNGYIAKAQIFPATTMLLSCWNILWLFQKSKPSETTLLTALQEPHITSEVITALFLGQLFILIMDFTASLRTNIVLCSKLLRSIRKTRKIVYLTWVTKDTWKKIKQSRT